MRMSVTDKLERLMNRLNYVKNLSKTNGFFRSEGFALEWAIQELSEKYPVNASIAKGRVERHARRDSQASVDVRRGEANGTRKGVNEDLS